MGCRFTVIDCDPGIFGEVLQLVSEGSCSDGDWVKDRVMAVCPSGESLATPQDGFSLFSLKCNLNTAVDEGNKLTE
jgi:hypothetical protein